MKYHVELRRLFLTATTIINAANQVLFRIGRVKPVGVDIDVYANFAIADDAVRSIRGGIDLNALIIEIGY